MLAFLKRLFRRTPKPDPLTPYQRELIAKMRPGDVLRAMPTGDGSYRSIRQEPTGASRWSDPSPSLAADLANPLNPLSPFSPMHHDYSPSPSHDTCVSSSFDTSSSYDSGSSCSGDSGSSW